MLSLPDRKKKIPLTDIILPLFDPDRMEKCLPHPSVFIFVLFCFPKCLKLSVRQITKIIFPSFGWTQTDFRLSSTIIQYSDGIRSAKCLPTSMITSLFGFQMADIYTARRDFETGRIHGNDGFHFQLFSAVLLSALHVDWYIFRVHPLLWQIQLVKNYRLPAVRLLL